ncbi:hypothetical protein K340107D12_43470 [Blautia parvula]|uniref:Transposase n=1 Tax=Blautia parvula TaxID=2877527 RepID=A0ABQ0BYC5_9FIRM
MPHRKAIFNERIHVTIQLDESLLIDLFSGLLYHVIVDNNMAAIQIERRLSDESRQTGQYYYDTP